MQNRALKIVEAEILNISNLPYVLTGEGSKTRTSHVHRQKCVSNYGNKTSMNVGNTIHNVTWVTSVVYKWNCLI